MDNKLYTTFKQGSRTYFYSSLFFPPDIREDVFVLYSFVRKADDYVDHIPQQSAAFYSYRKMYEKALAGIPSEDVIINSFIKLMEKRSFEPEWVTAFLDSMEMDLKKSRYATLDETLTYIYGSAEVIGLMMARVMDLHPDSYKNARMLGRSMQYINFIRDIDEDISLGRTYIPTGNAPFGNLDFISVANYQKKYTEFIRGEIDRYHTWQSVAEEGFRFIPKRYLIPIKTASDMYKWTSKKIYRNPYVVYRRKVKPKIPKILRTIAANTIIVQRTGA